jgi:hypothetical protein
MITIINADTAKTGEPYKSISILEYSLQLITGKAIIGGILTEIFLLSLNRIPHHQKKE